MLQGVSRDLLVFRAKAVEVGIFLWEGKLSDGHGYSSVDYTVRLSLVLLMFGLSKYLSQGSESGVPRISKVQQSCAVRRSLRGHSELPRLRKGELDRLLIITVSRI